MSKKLKASKLSAILIAVLVLFIIALLGGSVFAASLIMKKSTTTADARIDAETSADDPSQLQALKDYLAQNATAIQQTEALTASVGQYDQTQIVATLNGYARTAGVTITGFQFSNESAGAAGTTGATGATATGTTAVPTASDGSFGVTLGAPLRYRSFLVFMRLIENGLMPATITNGIITADPASPTTDITVTSLAIKVAQ